MNDFYSYSVYYDRVYNSKSANASVSSPILFRTYVYVPVELVICIVAVIRFDDVFQSRGLTMTLDNVEVLLMRVMMMNVLVMIQVWSLISNRTVIVTYDEATMMILYCCCCCCCWDVPQ